jgi:hypothetical protein
MCELEFAWLRERVTRGECHETSDLCDLFRSDYLHGHMRNNYAAAWQQHLQVLLTSQR